MADVQLARAIEHAARGLVGGSFDEPAFEQGDAAVLPLVGRHHRAGAPNLLGSRRKDFVNRRDLFGVNRRFTSQAQGPGAAAFLAMGDVIIQIVNPR